MSELHNLLFQGDNLEVLKDIDSESIDLIYIDPPFFSNRHYEVIWGDKGEQASFEDRWSGGINHYINWLSDRVAELYRVLKPTGSFYLHCDWHANAYIRVMILDKIFGDKNFVNEIIWSYQGTGEPQKAFKRKHDTIFLYSKTPNYFFNLEASSEDISEFSKQKFTKSDNQGLYKEIRHKDGKIYKQYIRNKMRMRDVWQIPIINSQSKERIGYPTQKPEALLEIIIKASSNEGDIILDAFCGGGTTGAVAERLGRRWIMCDVNTTAIEKTKQRLVNSQYEYIEIGKNYE